MNKKYLSVILFSALMLGTTGTFTSCKDYDDDIKNLQEQIDGQNKSLSEKLAAVESSIASLQSAQSAMQTDIANAQKAAQDAQTAADEAAKAAAEAKLAATEAQANAIAEAQKQLEAAKAELTELIQKGDETTQAEIDAANAEIAKVQGAVQALQAWQGTTDATLKNLADADAALETSLAGVQADLVDLANRVGKLEAGLKTQEDALAAYKEQHAADVSAIEEQLATLNEAVEKLAGLEPDDLVNMKNDITALEGQVGELSNSIAEINENLNILYIAVYKGITAVSLVDGYCVETGKYYFADKLQLISDIAVQTYTFGSDKYGDVSIRHMLEGSNLEGAVSFEKGTRQKLTAHALLRVSPANATITTSDIHLIDSKGNDLVQMGLVEVTNVDIFDGTLGSVATRVYGVTSGVTGLVEVEFQVGPKADEEGYDFDGEFMDAITVKDAKGEDHAKYFAVQISQVTNIPVTSEGSEAESFMRNVVSAYSLNLAPEKNANAGNLDFNLYKDINSQTEIKDINNRWSTNDDEKKGAVEYEWINHAVKADLIYTGSNATAWRARQACDDRTTNEAYSVKSGETFYVDLSKMNEVHNVKYFYIVLDRDFVNATGDQDSELAAWNSYESSIEGINKVYTIDDPQNAVAAMSISIPYSDVIGFRVYAANADGSLVDPDGKAFYVQVGEPAATITVPTQDVIATTDVDLGMKTAFINVADLEGWNELVAAVEASKAKSVDCVLDATMKEAIRGDKGDIDAGTMIKGNVFSVEYYKDNVEGSATITPNTLANLKAIKYIKLSIMPNVPASRLVDNETYEGKVTFKVATGGTDAGATTTVGIMNLSVKKVLPTIPTGYSAKANQVVNGKYLCYVLPGTINAALPNDGKMDGRMDLTNSFNVYTDFTEWKDGKPVYSTTVDGNYIFTFAEAAYKADNSVEDLIVKTAYEMTVDNSFIENGKGYATTVDYNFGDISYAYDEVTNKFVVNNWTKEIDSFTTEFHCVPSAQTWAWKEKSAFLEKDGKTGRLTYNKPSTAEYTLVSIIGTSSYDNTTYGGAFNKFWTNANTIAKAWDLATVEANVKVELISNNGQINEYFEPSISEVSTGGSLCINFAVVAKDIAPQADVASTLRLTMKDVFGHDVKVELPMNVHIDKGE